MKYQAKIGLFGLMMMMAFSNGLLMAQDDGPGPGGPPPGDNGGGRPVFDPAEMQKRMLEHTRQTLSVTNDDEWAVIQPMVQRVMEARREVGGGMMGMPGGPGGPGEGPGGTGRPDTRGSTERQALQKALDSSAPALQIKDALAKYRAAKQDKQTKLEKAQENLRSVLSIRQEAQAVLLGLLQ